MSKKPRNQNKAMLDSASDISDENIQQENNNSDDLENIEPAPEAVEEQAPQEEVIKAVEPSAFPEKLVMIEKFRIEMPLPGRTDAFFSLALKKDQEITDKRIIKHLLKSDALFITK